MNKMISNDENIRNLRRRKVLRIIIIIFSIATIVLSLLSIIYNINLIYALISFVITHVLMRVRDKIVINKIDDLDYVRKELKKNKK